MVRREDRPPIAGWRRHATGVAAVLAIQTADCVPLLMADPKTGAVAAAHVGWRGLAARVPAVAVKTMAEQFGTRPSDLVVAIGPSISTARYEVGEEVRARFEAASFRSDRLRNWFPAETRPAHWLFDAWQSALDQLEAAGVSFRVCIPRDSARRNTGNSSVCIAGTEGKPDEWLRRSADGERAKISSILNPAFRPRRN
jgi:YfiH family protein